MKESSTNFFARIQLNAESVEEIQVWCQELTPTAPGHRYASEWILCHLQDRDRSDFIELFKLDPISSNWEIVFEGEMSGWFDSYSGEYDESFDVVSEQHQVLPADFFPEPFPDEKDCRIVVLEQAVRAMRIFADSVQMEAVLDGKSIKELDQLSATADSVIEPGSFGRFVTAEYELRLLEACNRELYSALRWLIDDMTDAGDVANKETGKTYDSCDNAIAALQRHESHKLPMQLQLSSDLVALLYHEPDGTLNVDKEWDSNMLDQLGELMERHGLAPSKEEVDRLHAIQDEQEPA